MEVIMSESYFNAEKTIMLFNSQYKIFFNSRDAFILSGILAQRPTIDEFEFLCETWNIKYKIEEIKSGK
jgi:hypothetical protein